MKTINDYAELVKEKHALNKTIAPVETDLTDASREYHIGEQFIINGGLFKAKTEIAQHDALVLNTNYEPADNLTEQIKNAGGGTGTDPRLDVFENNIAPVETDETDASQPYQVGEQLILDNILYDVIAPISEHDVITTTGSGANIAPADPISSEIQTLTNKLDNEIVTRSALGAHNLLPFNLADIKSYHISGTWNGNSYTNAGVTFDIITDNNGDLIRVDVTGTATTDVQLVIYGRNTSTAATNLVFTDPVIASIDYVGSDSTARGIVWGSNSVFIEGSEVNLGANETVYGFAFRVMSGYQIPAGGISFKPMIRLASDADTTYRPYVPTNTELLSADTNAVLGAHQLLDYDLAKLKAVNTEGTWTNNSYLIKGITFVVNNDLSVTFSGTSDASVNPLFNFISSMVLDEDVIMSDGVNTDTYDYYLQATSSSASWNTKGQSPLIPKGTTLTSVRIRVATNRTIASTTFKPLIRLASDPSTKFTSYAMTNRELTEDYNNLIIPTSVTVDSVSIAANGVADIKLNNQTSIDVTNKIPSGYKLGAILFTWSTGHLCVPTQCYVSSGFSQKSFCLSLYNTSASAITVTSIDVVLICKKE